MKGDMNMGNKVLVLGIDGMDPKMCRRLVDEGKLPNIKKMLEMGSARKDLVMLGAQPTITPPMWTTMATGTYPMTHGITCYWNSHPTELDRLVYTFDTSLIKAEQIWESAVKAGKKALVWTWPCCWPARIDSPNLHIVGGLAPLGPNHTSAILDDDHLTYASVNCKEIGPREHMDLQGGAGCVMSDDMKEGSTGTYVDSFNEMGTGNASADNKSDDIKIGSIAPKAFLLFNHEEGEELSESDKAIHTFNSPLVEPKNWAHTLPEGAKEFYVLVSAGRSRFPALMLKNENGDYDRVEIYNNKKDAEPLVRVIDGEFHPLVVTEVAAGDEKIKATRHFTIVKIDPKGESVIVSAGSALAIEGERTYSNWKPESLYQQTVDIAGYVPHAIGVGGGYPEMISRRSLPSWDVFEKWQAKALLGLIEQNDYDAVFTHIHNCDHIGHPCWRWAKTRAKYGYNDEKVYQGFLEEVYFQCDDYIRQFLPLIDKGWDIIVTSDHGLLCSEEDELPYIGEAFVMNVGVMRDLGYTVLKKDENGKELREIDWEKTRAVAPRGNHIYINLKGRNPHGIVDPADKYELERQIINDLYDYRLNGKRVINIALRNKDAALLGLSGDRCGDIIYFLEEGFNRLHGDALSTTEGYFGTSVSPIFFAAGPGVKKGYETERVIREVDLAPTIAALLDVPMPEQCEGAPVYQILEQDSCRLK